MIAIVRSLVASRHRLRLALMLGAFSSQISLTAQLAVVHSSKSTNTNINQSVPTMKTFAILFHQSTRTLTDIDKQHLTEETIPWARSQIGAGRKLHPRILAPESV